MSRRGENIFKRKDGRWEARYVKGYTISGKIQYGFCYGKSYKEAKLKVLEMRTALRDSRPVSEKCNRRRFSFFCEEWLAAQREKVKDSTLVKYENTLRKHILPALGECMPATVSTQAVEAFKTRLLDEDGLSPKTVKDILMELHAILRYAASRYSGAFQAVEFHYPKEARREARVLTLEEQRRLVTYLQTDMDACKFGTLLALLTGLRIGELCALRWENLSIRDRTIRVETTIQRLRNLEDGACGKTKLVFGDPKSDTSARTIPMSDSVLRLCRDRAPRPGNTYVLTDAERFMEPRALQRRMEKYARACALPGVHFHTLRHTFATRCVEVGFELKSLSEILGHANPSVTLNRYVHSSLELKRKNLNKLSRVGL